MTDPIEWMTTSQAAQALAITPTTANSWARIGKLAGSAKDDRGVWLIRRSEVDRVLAEREAKGHRLRASAWMPITERREGRYS